MNDQTTVDRQGLDAMLSAACHFGHRVSQWNPKMRQYIFREQDGIHIFDLPKTAVCLAKALGFLSEAAASGKTILLASTKLQASRLITEAALKTGCPFVVKKWMPGLLTNFDTIQKRIKYFKELKAAQASGGWEKYTKKERLELARALEKLENAFSGVEQLTRLPDVLVVLDSMRDKLALREAKRLGIKTVGICDSNADPDLLTFPIPGNDDAMKALQYFAEQITEAILEGKNRVIERVPPQPASQAAPPVV